MKWVHRAMTIAGEAELAETLKDEIVALAESPDHTGEDILASIERYVHLRQLGRPRAFRTPGLPNPRSQGGFSSPMSLDERILGTEVARSERPGGFRRHPSPTPNGRFE